MTGIGPGDNFPAGDDDRLPPGDDNSYGLGDDEDEDDWEPAATFRPVADGAAGYFDPSQARMIRSLVSQVAELIGGEPDQAPGDGPGDVTPGSGDEADELEKLLGLSGSSELPDDPVLARLLPDAYSDDPDAAAEFRRYTEESLRAGKLETAQMVLTTLPPTGGEVVLNGAECQAWLRALNDVRLALGVRLGITDEEQDLAEDVPDNDPRAAYLMLYQWLAYLQDSLLDALT
jgi:Domain of unknown function (DUF2017)